MWKTKQGNGDGQSEPEASHRWPLHNGVAGSFASSFPSSDREFILESAIANACHALGAIRSEHILKIQSRNLPAR
uniref:Uncharacterized protein n=1 Tax=Physcomitrium patens TaxID=3218 RepID=A0A2K1LAE6_PHYPA|nr:hypothetical protein PHYPA_001421 [Physcomitrium patens]